MEATLEPSSTIIAKQVGPISACGAMSVAGTATNDLRPVALSCLPALLVSRRGGLFFEGKTMLGAAPAGAEADEEAEEEEEGDEYGANGDVTGSGTPWNEGSVTNSIGTTPPLLASFPRLTIDNR